MFHTERHQPFPAPFRATSTQNLFCPEVFNWDRHNKLITPRNYSANVAVEQSLAMFLTRIAYVGSRGNHLTVTIIRIRRCISPSTLITTNAVLTATFQISIRSASQGTPGINRRIFSLLRPFTHSFTISANYTWSKSNDNLPFNTDAATFGTSGYYTLPLNFPNFRRFDEGSSDFDHRHVFVASYVWQVPTLTNSNAFVRRALEAGDYGHLDHRVMSAAHALCGSGAIPPASDPTGPCMPPYSCLQQENNCGSVTISCLTG